ncbi:PadR family transcriptional regulator [Leifsonia poae]|uniref:PadR family transcriptional regulator n=1 Tax=Leifsonia poae TaxID=110933 RepID=UPI003D666E81
MASSSNRACSGATRSLEWPHGRHLDPHARAGRGAPLSPANGYQLRRELVSWNVDSWAKVNPGSIYSMLATLTKQGMLEATALPEGGRTVTVYTPTPAGIEELDRLIHDGIRTVTAMDPTGFRVALSFAPLLERGVFAGLLEDRLQTVRGGADGLAVEAERILTTQYAPPHVAYSLGLEGCLLAAEAEWIEDLLTVVRDGGLNFAGEDGGWVAPPEDAGWEMAHESARYREQLERLHAITAESHGKSA